LRKKGYDIFFAENGKEGLSVFRKISPILVILDLRMPVMDGFEFLEEIQIKPTDTFFDKEAGERGRARAFHQLFYN